MPGPAGGRMRSALLWGCAAARAAGGGVGPVAAPRSVRPWGLGGKDAAAVLCAPARARMEQALATRHMIGESMGMLMSSHSLTEEHAFGVLSRHSQEQNIKIRDIARRICERGTA